MRLNEFQELSKRTMPKTIDKDSKSNYSMGLAGESGEVVDLIKKEIHHDHPENPDKVKKELGDVLHYVAGLATMYGWTLEEVATANIMKLSTRYPQGFNTENSLKRVDTLEE